MIEEEWNNIPAEQGNKDLQTYIADFIHLTVQAKITDDSTKIQYFQDSLNMGILIKLLNTGDIPENFQKVIKTCVNIDKSYHHLMAIKNCHAPQKKSQKYGNPCYTSSCDPNMMEVDHMSQARKADHMRKGKYFNCH
ncbi:hypothetical protein BDR04DRAFT_1112843 [Suillus decipiens]|nr:hypothetical protein BDR04DRAFT_1112843 [Suillus decipiens]